MTLHLLPQSARLLLPLAFIDLVWSGSAERRPQTTTTTTAAAAAAT